MVQRAAGAATALIPVPLVGGALTFLVDTAIARVKAESNKYKINKYGNGSNEKQVKHEIKSLNVETLDRSRAKVKSAVEDLNKALSDLDWLMDETICNHRVNVAHKYHYLEKRIDLLDERAAAFEVIGQHARAWAKEQRINLDKSLQDWNRKVAQDQEPRYHNNCSGVCVKPQTLR